MPAQSHIVYTTFTYSTDWSEKLFRTTPCPEKESGVFQAELHQILTNFWNSFTVTISRKFPIKLSLNIPPHLKHIILNHDWDMSWRFPLRRFWHWTLTLTFQC